MEYVPLRAELEYVVCPETGGGFVMGFEFELLFAPPQDSSTKGEHRTADLRSVAKIVVRIDSVCMG
ncbi:MAG: hypothetical protein ACYCOU_05450 [Sulfobacillus sp.]